jgi:antitoxin component of MazEF toxin-antitoxin module
MVSRTGTRISRYSGGRHSIYLPNNFATDSQFPFNDDDELEILIQGDKLLVQRVGKGR